MGRLSEYEPWDEYDPIRANPRDEFLTRVYIEGRNAARDGKPQTAPPEYAGDSLALINWETGYEDWTAEQITREGEWQLLRGHEDD